jgi:hypothetical protein
MEKVKNNRPLMTYTAIYATACGRCEFRIMPKRTHPSPWLFHDKLYDGRNRKTGKDWQRRPRDSNQHSQTNRRRKS